jgi:hypothetical protein
MEAYMKVVKFSINEDYYNLFKEECVKTDITIKRKLNVILSQDRQTENFTDVYPADHHEKRKPVTLKVNEELYKSIMKNCGRYDVLPKKYLPYLIYKFLLTNGLSVAPTAEEKANFEEVEESEGMDSVEN